MFVTWKCLRISRIKEIRENIPQRSFPPSARHNFTSSPVNTLFEINTPESIPRDNKKTCTTRGHVISKDMYNYRKFNLCPWKQLLQKPITVMFFHVEARHKFTVTPVERCIQINDAIYPKE